MGINEQVRITLKSEYMSVFDIFRMSHLFQFSLRHSADAVGGKVCISGLYATQTAEILIPLLLPLSNQICICDSFFQTVVIQFYNKNNYVMCPSR